MMINVWSDVSGVTFSDLEFLGKFGAEIYGLTLSEVTQICKKVMVLVPENSTSKNILWNSSIFTITVIM